MNLDRTSCYRAIANRDARFDGRLFTAVRTTGIYCRPICPARLPKLENVVFCASAAAAQEAGFRPCLRCRPESSPDLAAWRGRSNIMSRALALILEGALDGDDASVAVLAAQLGLDERHLCRLFRQHLGATPISVAQTRRVLFAKQLIHETRMSMADVALAAGFSSTRRFSDTLNRLYQRPPSALRRKRLGGSGTARADPSAIALTLSYAPPYDWPAMIAFFAARAIRGVEQVEPDRYRRTITVGGAHGTIDVAPLAGKNALAVIVRFPIVKALRTIVAHIKRMFDLDTDVSAINAHLATDRHLATLIAARPGLRVPGAWDGFESAVRALLGQQITVAAARGLIGTLATQYGTPLAPDRDDTAGCLTHIFPNAARLAAADLSVLRIPKSRRAALATLAHAAAADPRLFDTSLDFSEVTGRLKTMPGIGDWTAQHIAMRALRDPDAFPAADVGLLRALPAGDGGQLGARDLLAIAEAWRPWRAYAAQHLWSGRPAAPTTRVRPRKRQRDAEQPAPVA